MTAIRSLMVTEMVTVGPKDTVMEAAKRMRQNRVGAVLIVEGPTLVGIFSERDLLNAVVAAGRDPQKTAVGDVASRDVVTIDVGQPLKRVLEILRTGPFRHLPVTENGKPVGILSTRDFLGFLVERLEEYIEDLRYRRELTEGIDPYERLGGSYAR